MASCSYKGDGHDCRKAIAEMRAAAACLDDAECAGNDGLRRQTLKERWYDSIAMVNEYCRHKPEDAR